MEEAPLIEIKIPGSSNDVTLVAVTDYNCSLKEAGITLGISKDGESMFEGDYVFLTKDRIEYLIHFLQTFQRCAP